MKVTDKQKCIIRNTAVAVGMLFILYGAYRGEIDTVMSKAVRLCLECVGIG